MEKLIESNKHIADKRAHIPTTEEQGYEDENAKVKAGKKILELPKNPVVHRGQDPELFWLDKYGNDDRDELLRVDIRSLYRHEHIAPETLIKNLYKTTEVKNLFSDVNTLFGNALDKDEVEKVSEYYRHQDGWTNRLIQGDSHLVMASLLEREGMAGQVQTIYFDPPYGIKYGGNWQIKLNNRDVKDGNDEALTSEPEQIKAFRDTWELGIHSYLSYLRDRLLIAKELLTESGSCFVQISDENVHLVRNIMDEVFGSENFCSLISFRKTSGAGSIAGGTDVLASTCDYIIWYAKNKIEIKFRQLYTNKNSGEGEGMYTMIELTTGERRRMNEEEKANLNLLPKDSKIFRADNLTSQSGVEKTKYDINLDGRIYKPAKGVWKTSLQGMDRLLKKKRIIALGQTLSYVRYFSDFPFQSINNFWEDTGMTDKLYVVQSATKVIQRCILMTTDPGDLVLDPTCGSGTTSYVAEQWGRRWITIDTSRIAINIAKQRLMTAVFPYYKLYSNKSLNYDFSDLQDDGDSKKDKPAANNNRSNQKNQKNHSSDNLQDIRQGFIYKTVPHITLKSLANDEPPATETLYDQPETDNKKLRVSGPFTVETLQNFEPVSPESLDDERRVNETEGAFEETIKQHLVSAGIKNGSKKEMTVFRSVELLTNESLNAEGFYVTDKGEQKAYFHIGPKFGTVSKKLVNEAIKECRLRGDANWLVILGFSFESDIEGSTQTTSMGNFEVTKVRIHDDLLQEGLKKKPAKSAASFVTIGEPDIILERDSDNKAHVTINGLDIYDPIRDELKARNVHDISYWMLDDDYDGSNFVVKQIFFCGGEKTEFNKWKNGLDNLAKDKTKKNVEKTFKIEIDDEAFDQLYGYVSHPIEIKRKGQKIAVRIISQFGEECTKVLVV